MAIIHSLTNGIEMQIAIVSVPINHQGLIGHRPFVTGKEWGNGSVAVMGGHRCKVLTVRFCSSSPSTSVVDDGSSVPPEYAVDDGLKVLFRGCKACGKEEVENGCNGEGRIQGGIATVPGFGWWPIKAYRPCPGFVASGGRYRRRGQSMDEVAFGRGESGQSMD